MNWRRFLQKKKKKKVLLISLGGHGMTTTRRALYMESFVISIILESHMVKLMIFIPIE